MLGFTLKEGYIVDMIIDFQNRLLQIKLNSDILIGVKTLGEETYLAAKGMKYKHTGIPCVKTKIWDLTPYLRIKSRNTDIKVSLLF